MLAEAGSSSVRLLMTGPVPGWAGTLLFAAVGTIVVHQLRRDFHGSPATRLTRRGLPALRLGVVGTIVWLLWQPVLLISHHWTPRPEVMLVTDAGHSMAVDEGAGNVSQQLNAMEAVGQQPVTRRNSSAMRADRACSEMHRLAASAAASLQADVDAATTGLPLGPSLAGRLNGFARELLDKGDALSAARARLPLDNADKATKQPLAQLAAKLQLVSAAADSLIADSVIVGREAAKSPALLDAYLTRMKALSSDAATAAERASAVQQSLDQSLLKPADIEKLGSQPMTRATLAGLVAQRLSAQSGSGPTWSVANSPTLTDAMNDAFRRSLTSPLAGVVLLSDGSDPPPSRAGEAQIGNVRVPVSTVLIGTDGVEPADSGVVAIEAPRLLVAHEPAVVRCLVKNRVSTPVPKLTLTVGGQVVATRDVPVNRDGYDRIELSWTPRVAGRVQVVAKIESPHPDAFPGNEQAVSTVDVIPARARAVIVSDRLSSDFAGISQVLAAMPAVDAHAIVAAPGLAKFHLGSKAEDFPKSPDDFKAISLLVLLGDVPAAGGDDVVPAVKRAVEAGLRVWVQAPQAGRAGRSWATALDVELKPIDGRKMIAPVKNLWLSQYQLGRDAEASLAQWGELPAVACLSEITTPGVTLLTADDRCVFRVIPRGGGAIVASGIGEFAAMRNATSVSAVNRLLFESLSLGLVPMTEPGAAGGIFPSQPVLGRNVALVGDAVAEKGPEPTESVASTPEGVRWMRVTDPDAIRFRVGGQPVERAVSKLTGRQDFQLAAHAAPLEAISRRTGGRHRTLYSLGDLLPEGLVGTPRSSVRRVAFWSGPWLTFLLLLLVTAEYLLRRRAGKVM